MALLALPQELEDCIFDFLDTRDFRQLCQVNHYLHEHYEKRGYRSIHLQTHTEKSFYPSRRPPRLLWTLLRRPDLRACVRELSIDFSDEQKANMSLVEDVVLGRSMPGFLEAYNEPQDVPRLLDGLDRGAYSTCAVLVLILAQNITHLQLMSPRSPGVLGYEMVSMRNMLHDVIQWETRIQKYPAIDEQRMFRSLRHLSLINQHIVQNGWTSLMGINTINMSRGAYYQGFYPCSTVQSITLGLDVTGLSAMSRALRRSMSIPVIRLTSICEGERNGMWVYVQDFLRLSAPEKKFHTLIFDDSCEVPGAIKDSTELPQDALPSLSDSPKFYLDFSVGCPNLTTLAIPLDGFLTFLCATASTNDQRSSAGFRLPPNLKSLWITNVTLSSATIAHEYKAHSTLHVVRALTTLCRSYGRPAALCEVAVTVILSERHHPDSGEHNEDGIYTTGEVEM
ncbi:hypothetical protein EJ05DRAFT_93293 [Pseudovirgaria hyperparasitica]|uniref:F-box domain-containing protein n=1 Tax=Pseudovirgaria hyperparasitica TaxID=470096 RepID=A0A6A6W101_9PEZI|nr:uncharacterized protein EJ05DRAFT_93293 [Pseudovirgaria hyperparasitica]KAF2756195.1 hypothetical protein EJ05DRAFT_93293 [Pseudovirgaria hyperparasitica]